MCVKMRGTRQREIENLLNKCKQDRKKIKWTTYGVRVQKKKKSIERTIFCINPPTLCCEIAHRVVFRDLWQIGTISQTTGYIISKSKSLQKESPSPWDTIFSNKGKITSEATS